MDKIQKGDEVIVIAGKDKGKRGASRCASMRSIRVVEGINVVKKHEKPNPMKGTDGRHRRQDDADPRFQRRIVQRGDWKADRVSASRSKDGKKVRFFKSNGAALNVVNAH